MELTIDRLTKQYKNKFAVDRISLTLNTGVYGLLGACFAHIFAGEYTSWGFFFIAVVV